MMMNDMPENSTMMGMCVMMGIAGLLFIVVLGVTVYFVVRSLVDHRMKNRPSMILRERIANGELDQEEYLLRRKWLDENSRH